jgi:hypothetical protein
MAAAVFFTIFTAARLKSRDVVLVFNQTGYEAEESEGPWSEIELVNGCEHQKELYMHFRNAAPETISIGHLDSSPVKIFNAAKTTFAYYQKQKQNHAE